MKIAKEVTSADISGSKYFCSVFARVTAPGAVHARHLAFVGFYMHRSPGESLLSDCYCDWREHSLMTVQHLCAYGSDGNALPLI